MSTLRNLCGSVAPAIAMVCLSSCALTDKDRAAVSASTAVPPTPGAPLQSGVKYEVRKALAAGVPFKPTEIKRYYFVLEAPRPPMLAAATPAAGKHIKVRTTAYCHQEDDHIAFGPRNALGTPLKFGTVRSAAADWSRYPVGTRFRIAGQPNIVYEVDDYGSALVGTGTIDIYKPNRELMDEWGVRHVDIEVLHWGSYQRSMDIMRNRLKWPHVRKMVESIQYRLNQLTQTTLPAKPAASAPL